MIKDENLTWREKEIWNDGYAERFGNMKPYIQLIRELALQNKPERIAVICDEILEYGEPHE
jgi:hypothetical protein